MTALPAGFPHVETTYFGGSADADLAPYYRLAEPRRPYHYDLSLPNKCWVNNRCGCGMIRI